MTDKKPPLRGPAAYKALTDSVSKNNDAAQKRGRAERAARDAHTQAKRRAAEEREFSSLPEQPEP